MHIRSIFGLRFTHAACHKCLVKCKCAFEAERTEMTVLLLLYSTYKTMTDTTKGDFVATQPDFLVHNF